MASNTGTELESVHICPEGDHEGSTGTRKMPQEDQSPSMYLILYMCTVVNRYYQSRYRRTYGKLTFKVYAIHCTYVPSHDR